MPKSRLLSRTLRDLVQPIMGQPLGGGTNSTPSSLNDLVNQIAAIETMGYNAACGVGSNVAGTYKPLVGDYGVSFLHSGPLSVQFNIGIPYGLNRYSLSLWCKSINPTHYIRVRLEKDGFWQDLSFDGGTGQQSSTQLGTGPAPHLFSGPLSSDHVVTNPLGGVEMATLFLEVDKSALAGVPASAEHKYWDGIWSFSLNFYKN